MLPWAPQSLEKLGTASLLIASVYARVCASMCVCASISACRKSASYSVALSHTMTHTHANTRSLERKYVQGVYTGVRFSGTVGNGITSIWKADSGPNAGKSGTNLYFTASDGAGGFQLLGWYCNCDSSKVCAVCALDVYTCLYMCARNQRGTALQGVSRSKCVRAALSMCASIVLHPHVGKSASACRVSLH